jgi:Zn(2)-Cys(6) binuclear cluster domain-containing protein
MAATAPAPSKFRDSCHACASSKVKCQKEKPTCSRCAKRGITCEYIVTKRAGRKHHENRSNNKTPPTRTATQALPGSSWYTNPPTSSGVDYLISPSLIQLSPRQNTPTSSSDSFSSVFSPIDPFVSSVLTNLSTGFDDFFASTVSFPVPEMSDSDIPS